MSAKRRVSFSHILDTILIAFWHDLGIKSMYIPPNGSAPTKDFDFSGDIYDLVVAVNELSMKQTSKLNESTMSFFVASSTISS